MRKVAGVAVGLVLYILVASTSLWAEEPKSGKSENVQKEKVTVLEEITVKGAFYSNPVMPVNTLYGTQYNVVTEEQIKERNAYDFQSALQDVPGVMYQSKNLIGSQTSHSLYIRGRGASHPTSDVVVEFDGVPRYGALFGQVLGDGIAVPTIGSIEIYKSPQPAEFGSGYAAINIRPKYMTQEGQEIVHSFSAGGYSTFNESLAGGVKQGPFDVYVAQSWLSTDGHVAHSRAQQQNYYANTGYSINDKWNVRFLANYVQSQTLAPMPTVTPTSTNGVSWPGAERYDTETIFTTLTLSHQHEKLNGYLKVYIDDTTFDLLQELTNGQRYGSGSGGLWSRQEIAVYGVRAKEKFHFWTGGEVIVGADIDRTELKNTQRTYSGQAVSGINGGRAVRIWDFPDTTMLSPYIALSHFWGREQGFHITPSAGFRYYHHNEFKDNSAPQIGLVAGYKHTDLNFNYSRGVNYPSPIVVMNMVLTSSPTSNPSQYWKDIKPEIVDHYEAGLTHTWPETASLKAAAFYDRGKDRVQAYMYGSIPTQFNDPIGQYEIRGLELSGSLTPVKNLELSAGATWMDAKATGNNGVEVDNLPYTPRFALQGGVNWQFFKNFKAVTNVQYFNNIYAGTSSRSNTFNYTELNDNYKLKDITLWNARLSYSFDYKKLRLNDSEIFLAVNNILNQDYEYAKGYTMPGIMVFGGYTVKFH